MQAFTRFCLRVVQSYLPDAYILAVLLTFVTFFAGIGIAEKGLADMIQYWGKETCSDGACKRYNA